MDPGSRDAYIEAVYRIETQDARGGTEFTTESQGFFWGTIVYVTRTIAFSGYESAKNINADIPLPVTRITFEMDYAFDYDKVEFHFEGQVYVPRNPGLRTKGNKISYNCIHYTPRSS